jgi:aryl-alcohol dehydrogenase-like predicted oxidoreductase
MAEIDAAGSFVLGSRVVHRMGYGAMQLAGPRVFGLPRDRNLALAVLREAVGSGVDHIDTSDFYGPLSNGTSDRRRRRAPTAHAQLLLSHSFMAMPMKLTFLQV